MDKNLHLTRRTKHVKGLDVRNSIKQEQSRRRSHKYYQITGTIFYNQANKRLSYQQQQKINSQQLGSTMDMKHALGNITLTTEMDLVENDCDYTFDGDYDTDSFNDVCGYNKPNNYVTHNTNNILGCIELSIGGSAANMSHVIYMKLSCKIIWIIDNIIIIYGYSLSVVNDEQYDNSKDYGSNSQCGTGG